MKKSMAYKAAAAALSAAILVTSAGCGTKKEASVEMTKLGETKITKEPSELSLFYISTGDKHLEDLEVWKEIAKKTNISLKTVSSKSASDETTAFNTLLASGDLPDLVMYSKAKQTFPKYGKEGAFAKLNDLIDKYAPNIQKELEDVDVREYFTAADGNIYFLAGINPHLPASGWFVRKDWLEKLGLKEPTTVQEYHDMLVAFRDGDPNGNGIKDEVPYFNRFDGIGHLLLLFDTVTNWEIRGDKIVYGPTTEEFKTAYENLAQWYAEGLIDKEIFTRGAKSRDKLLGDNVGGSTHDWFGSTSQYNDFLKETVPGIKFEPIAPPNKKEYTQRDLVNLTGIAISDTSVKKEAAIRFIDFMFSEEGSRLSNFGIEGKHYDMKDGYPTFQDWVLNGEKTTIDILDESGVASAFPHKFDFRYEEQWLLPEARKGMEEYKKYLVPAVPVLTYESDEEEEKFNKIMTDVRTYIDEITQKWIFGSASVKDTYAEYKAEIEKLGINEAAKIQQTAYERYLEKKKELSK